MAPVHFCHEARVMQEHFPIRRHGTRRRATFAVIAVVTASSDIASSQEPSLEVVQVTATRAAADAHAVSLPVAVVPHAELVRNVPLTVVDHLRGEPGTYIQQTTPAQGIPIIRGLKGSEVLHLVD